MRIILESCVRKRKIVKRKGKAWGFFGKFVYSIKVTNKPMANKHIKLYIEVYTNKPTANDHVN